METKGIFTNAWVSNSATSRFSYVRKDGSAVTYESRQGFDLRITGSDLERFAEAANHLREAVQLKPEAYDAHSELGFAYYKVGRLPAAAETLRTAIRLKGDTAKLFNFDPSERCFAGAADIEGNEFIRGRVGQQ